MASWSTRRKYGYFFAFIVAAVLIVGVPLFFFLYKAPSCSDGKQDGTERGVDCGGSCSKLCPADYGAVKVLWAYSSEVVPGTYNALAYAENPNPSVQAQSVPYLFKLYDAQGVLVAERQGVAFVPAGQKFAVFEGAIQTGNRIPLTTTFEFTGTPNWVPGAALTQIQALDTNLTQGSSPSAQVDVQNSSVDQTYSGVTAVIVLYDKDDNRIGFSKTVIDSIAPGQKTSLFFTWPEAFPSNVVRTEVLFTDSSAR